MFQPWQGEGVQRAQASKITPASPNSGQRLATAPLQQHDGDAPQRRTAATHHNCRRMPVLVIAAID
jgi:hypothetical protein